MSTVPPRSRRGRDLNVVWADPDGALAVHQVGSGQAALLSAASPPHDRANEDAAAIILNAPECCVLAVADGVGGAAAGEQASQITIATLAAALDGVALEEAVLGQAIIDGMTAANQAVRGLGGGAASTLVVAMVCGQTLRSYHVGDAWLLHVGQRGKVKHRSIDHGPVGYALESGLLGEAEALHHAERHVVSNVVGAEDMRIELGPRLMIAARDTVLLASDGLSDNLFQDEIVQVVRCGPLANAGRELAARCWQRMRQPAAGQPSKPDDLSFVLYRARVPAA